MLDIILCILATIGLVLAICLFAVAIAVIWWTEPPGRFTEFFWFLGFSDPAVRTFWTVTLLILIGAIIAALCRTA